MATYIGLIEAARTAYYSAAARYWYGAAGDDAAGDDAAYQAARDAYLLWCALVALAAAR